MDVCRGTLLVQEISSLSPMSVAEARAVQRKIFTKGPASREEAEAVIHACCAFDTADVAWRTAAAATIRDSLLGQCDPFGMLEFDGEDWLINCLSDADRVDADTRFAILHEVLCHARNATMRLGMLGLRSAVSSARQQEQAGSSLRVHALA